MRSKNGGWSKVSVLPFFHNWAHAEVRPPTVGVTWIWVFPGALRARVRKGGSGHLLSLAKEGNGSHEDDNHGGNAIQRVNQDVPGIIGFSGAKEKDEKVDQEDHAESVSLQKQPRGEQSDNEDKPFAPAPRIDVHRREADGCRQ